MNPGYVNRQWLLAKRPSGAVSADCFEYRETVLPERLRDSDVLVRHELVLCAPTIRNGISAERNNFYSAIEIGAPIRSPAVGTVVSSTHPDWPVGTRLVGPGSWQDLQWIAPDSGHYRVVPEAFTSVDALGVIGINALTGYFGLLRIGQPKSGETLLVSGAAGSVGSMVAQIARIKGLRVIALCSEGKRAWMQQACGISHVLDYKRPDLISALDAIAPDGIDIYFDNVGGPLLPAVLGRTRRLGRIVLCGQISTYDQSERSAIPPLDMMRMVYGHIRMEGFIVSDYAEQFAEATLQLAQWDSQGLLAHREDVRCGFKELPETFMTLFSGRNQGTLIARIADEGGLAL